MGKEGNEIGPNKAYWGCKLMSNSKKVPHHRNWTEIQYISVRMSTIHSHSIMWSMVLISVNWAH